MRTLLLIDEHPQDMALIRSAFSPNAFRVLAVLDSNNGLVLFQQQQPDLAMVGVEGLRGPAWALVERLRARDRSTPILILGTVSSEAAARKAYGLGCSYMYKDPRLERFLPALRDTVQKMFSPSPPDLGDIPFRGRLLVVDDEPDTRDVLELVFKAKGVKVWTASDGDEALALLRRERPHVMLLDMRLPGMSGIDILKSAREIDKNLAVIMITANGEMNLALETLQNGACDYIMKPFDLNYLETSVMSRLLMTMN